MKIFRKEDDVELVLEFDDIAFAQRTRDDLHVIWFPDGRGPAVPGAMERIRRAPYPS
jgi:hypothetical protein